jgi:glycosyltransferase involved in cell wall biosynthesis
VVSVFAGGCALVSEMKIAHICAVFPPYHSGTGTVCLYNALYLARLGHDVTVITAHHPEGEFEYPSEIKVKRLPSAFRIGNAPLLPGLLAVRDFDILHLHLPFIFGAELTYLNSVLNRIPFVVTYHNDLIGDGARKPLFDIYARTSIQMSLRTARRICTVSLDHAKHSQLRWLGTRAKEAIVEIPNGVDIDLFQADEDGTAIRQQHGIPLDARVITFVGALDRAHHFKGIEYLLESIADYLRTEPDVVLMLVGDGDLKEQYIARTRELGIHDRVVFVGFVPSVVPYLAASDVVILPSFPPESFGVVLLEAMACQRPVVAHDIPGVRSVISDGEDGFLVEPHQPHMLVEKLKCLLDNPAMRKTMGINGRTKVESRYTWPKIVEHLEQVYEDVIADAAR